MAGDGFRRFMLGDPKHGNLYGAIRNIEARKLDGSTEVREYGDRELAGFFQLFHSSDPNAQCCPLLDEFNNASGYDSEFMKRWPPERRIILPMNLLHLGEPGRNWCGVGNDEAMRELWNKRRDSRGYQHERINP